MNRNERPFVERLPPEVMINEIRWLSFFQEKLLGEYYDQGLRGDDLRSWVASGEFTYRHYETYKWLVQEKHVDLKLAIRALDGLDNANLDVLKDRAFAQYQKLVAAPSNQTATDKERKNIIVGLGPVGLASVIEAARNDSKHRKIIAFTNRSEYTRKQVIKIDLDDYEYLKSLVGEEKLNDLTRRGKIVFDYDRMRKHRVVFFQTKELEELLNSELNSYRQNGLLEIIDVNVEPESKINSFNKKTHTAILENGREIPFDILVGVDGAKHELENMLHDVEDFPIDYHEAQKDQFHDLHAVINFKLPSGYDMARSYRRSLPKGEDVIALDRVAVTIDPEKLSRLKAMGWEHDSLPEVRIFCNDDILYIGGECAAEMRETPEKREAWMREVLRTYLPQDKIDGLTVMRDKHGRPDNNLFEITLDEASQPVYKFPKYLADPTVPRHSARMLIMGDALRKTHYHTGSGALTGLREAQAFGEFLRTKQTSEDWNAFIYKLNELRDTNRERVNGYLEMRTAREKKSSIKREREEEETSPNLRTRKFGPSCPVTQQLDEACALMGLDRRPLYVCDPREIFPRFDKAYQLAMSKVGDLMSIEEKRKLENAARIIRDDLEAREFRFKGNFLADYTSHIHDENSDECTSIDEGRAKNVCLSYVTSDNQANLQEKVFHFYKFDLSGTSVNTKVDNPQYCQFRVDASGHCRLVIPDVVGLLPQKIRGKFGLGVQISQWYDEDPALVSRFNKSIVNSAARKFQELFTNQLQKSPALLNWQSTDDNQIVANFEFDLQGEEINKALAVIHSLFQVNPLSTPQQLISVMQEKIHKYKNAESPQRSVSRHTFFADQHEQLSENNINAANDFLRRMGII